jgi:hypothetical protein
MALTEEKRTYRPRAAAVLHKIRDLSGDTPNPVRVMVIVVESVPGEALVQDILDEMGKQASLRATLEQTLEIAQKYILIGNLQVESGDEGKELRLLVSSVNNVNSLDIKLYKEVLELEERVNRIIQ